MMMLNLNQFNQLLIFKFLILIFICLVGTESLTENFNSNHRNNNRNHNDNNFSNSNDIDELKKVNFMIGISKIAENYDNSTLTQCRQELIQFLNAIKRRDVWALKLIDSFGNTPISFHGGNHFWFSSRDLCEDLNDPYQITLNHKYQRVLDPEFFNSTSPFPVYLRMIFYNFTSPMYLDMKVDIEPYIHVGLCIPRSCGENEILQYANQYFQNQSFEIQQLFNIQMSYIHTKAPKFQWSYLLTLGVLLAGGCVAFTVIMTLLAYANDYLQKHHHKTDSVTTLDNNNTTNSKSKDEKFYEKLLKCWSLKDNIAKLLKTEDTTSFISVIAGLKTIVCVWIIVLHCSSLALYIINNTTIAFAKMENLMYQIIMQAIFYVDVFFIISAFLLVYNFLSNSQRLATIKSNSFGANVKLFAKLVLHRYLRFVPILFAVMIAAECIYDFLDMYTPFYLQKNIGIYCKETWWYNIFFINNFLDLKDVCVSWSWYLSCEFQYFIFFTLILFIFAKNELFGKVLFVLCTIILVTNSFMMYFHYEMTFQIDVIYQTMQMLYVHPLARISPYFGGAFMGWLYFKTKSTKLNLKKSTILSFWITAGLYFLWTTNMTYLRLTPIWIVSIMMSFGKLLFGLIIGCTIFLSLHGYGGIFNTVMSSKLFIHLNKYSYSAYMLNPLFIQLIFGMKGDSTALSDADKLLDCIAIVGLAFFASFFLVLLWEIPFQKLSQRLIKY